MILRENYLKKIEPFMDTDLIKVLTGMRRSGKSVILEQIANKLQEKGIKENQIIKYNFENMKYTHLQTAQSLHEQLSKDISKIEEKAYIFLDEIQEVNEWEKCINSIRVEYNSDIYITGSNANLLSSELSTYLSGRYVEIKVYPFSYKEFLKMYKAKKDKFDEKEIFEKYVTLGGMPYISQLNFAEETSEIYLKDLFNSVVLKDVVKRNKIRDIDLLERIIEYVIKNIGTIFSATTISKYFKSENRKVSPETIMNYLKACENAYLFEKVKREEIGKKVLAINEKYYLADHGIREALYGNNKKDINLILENLVYLELKRQGYEITIGKLGELEIDFICKKKDKIKYYQVTYLLASESTIEREFKVLEKINDNYPKYVLSLDEFDFSRNGIEHKNIKTFLKE